MNHIWSWKFHKTDMKQTLESPTKFFFRVFFKGQTHKNSIQMVLNSHLSRQEIKNSLKKVETWQKSKEKSKRVRRQHFNLLELSLHNISMPPPSRNFDWIISPENIIKPWESYSFRLRKTRHTKKKRVKLAKRTWKRAETSSCELKKHISDTTRSNWEFSCA